MTMSLRLLDSVRDHDVLDLPVAARGTIPALRAYARRQGYEWKPVPDELFGGWYAHPETGACLFLAPLTGA